MMRKLGWMGVVVLFTVVASGNDAAAKPDPSHGSNNSSSGSNNSSSGSNNSSSGSNNSSSGSNNSSSSGGSSGRGASSSGGSSGWGGGSSSGGPHGVPEVDPSSLLAAVGLVSGSLALVAERRRRRGAGAKPKA